MKLLSGVRFLATTCLLAISSLAWSQSTCDAHHKHEQLYSSNPSYRQAMDRFNERMEQVALTPASANRVETVYSIPVVVHIMHNGEPYGQGTNITDEQVYSAITALNNDWRKVAGTNGAGSGEDVGVQFCLASRNPQGQPTTGINRVNASSVALYSTNGIQGSGNNGASEATVKALSTWPRTSYINIWVVSEIDNNDAGAGVQGYAYYPYDTPLDGIVLLYNAFGTVGNLKSYTNMNRVLSHEMGHVFNLMHTFENTTACGAETSCSTQGDRVCDTPPTILNSSCSAPACSGSQQIQNYMDYTSQTCQNMFSLGQKTRIRNALETMRTSLISSLGCMPVFTRDTGISSVIRPAGSSCATSYTPQVTLTNYGSATLTNCTINYNVDGAGSQTYAWTGSLGASSSVTINLPSISAGMGAHTFYAWTSNPNGAADQNGSNDQSTSTFTVAAGASLTLTVVLDYYGSENTWQILDASNNVIAFGGPYADFQQGTSVVESICVPAGCYSLVFTDAFGDGQSFPSGSFTLRNSSNTVLATASNNWGATNTQNFCVTVTSSGSAPVASFSVADNIICRSATASFTNTSSNSPTSYAWTFTGGTPSSSTSANPGAITYATAGTYNVVLTVTNANGSNTYTCTNCVTVITGPTVSLAGTNPNCAGSVTGSIASTVSGGYSPYTYAWSNNSTSANISGVGAGAYSTTVTNSQGCTTTASATLTAPSSMSITGAVSNAACSNGTGSITVSASGGTGAKTFAWSNGQTGVSATNLVPGSYVVTATDANGCTSTQSFTVTAPVALALSGTVTNVSCNGASNGSVVVSATGGTGNKTYTWSTGATGATLANVAAGTYSVTATDANGCSASQSFTLSNPVALSISGTKTQITCAGLTNGAVALNVNGGTGNKTYLWSNGATTADVSALGAGNYSVTVTDANGCTASQSFAISSPAALNVGAITNNVTCSGNTNGSIALVVTGGTGARTFSWNNGSTSANLTNLAVGSYSVSVTDAAGCSTSQTFNIAAPAPMVVAGTVGNVSCASMSNGYINASVTGGTGNKTYLWNNGSTSANLNSLVAGNYMLTVTDGNGCVKSQSFTVTQPTALSSNLISYNPSCGALTGSASVAPDGGTAPYSVIWNTGATTSGVNDLSPGSYSVSITDSNGCQLSESFVIDASTGLSVAIVNNDITCAAAANGSALAAVAGGQAPYAYSWSSGSTANEINSLTAGTYTVTVTDANGCSGSAQTIISEPAPLTMSISSSDVTCFGLTNGFAIATTNGGTGNISVQWNNGIQGPFAEGLESDVYTATATDANGCQASLSVGISEPSALSVSVVNISAESCTGNDGAASIIVDGGSPEYTLLWSHGFTGTDATDLSAGSYLVTVADNNGCGANVEFDVVFDCNTVVPTTRLVDADCGATNVPLNGIVSCEVVTDATSYQWKFANLAGQYLGETTTTGNQFFVSQIPGADYGTSIQVSIRVQVQGAWGEIGDVCSITIAPEVVSTGLVDADCGSTVAEWNRTITATEIPGAVEYQWHFLGQDFDFTSITTIPSLILTNTMNFTPGQTYLVEVRCDLGDGTYTPWGSSCELSFFSSIEVKENMNSTIQMLGYPNPNAGSNITLHFGNLSEAVVVQNIVLFDAIGNVVEQANLQTTVKNSMNYTFKNQLASGVYVLKAVVNNSTCEMKLIVR